MATLTSFFGGGGGSAAPLPHFVFTNSITGWVPPHNGDAYIHVIGCGGNGNNSSGGGAGGYCRKLITLANTDSYNLTIGVPVSGFDTQAASSIFTNTTTLTLTATGGYGGGAGSAGGSASGGDVNYTGGAGGTYQGSNAKAGGGAVNITGTAYAGGSAININGGGSCGGGGAGIGGVGGTSFTQSNNWSVGGGGGSGGPGFTSGESSPTSDGVYGKGGPSSIGKPYGVIGFDFIKEWGTGGSYRQRINQSNGATVIFAELQPGVGGGGASGAVYRQGAQSGQNGGLFGGGGAYGGNGGLGGGGGADYGFSTSSGINMKYGIGGAGVIFVEYVTLA